ncbi:hypothetical protein appser4_15460 [Actinobacillus pleuropneumoniae serovar 4 str. M62]|nr:hypothetical protein appser4_15460 [Actinobacillus pleuropneumoniae serovar 4 str. M62]
MFYKKLSKNDRLRFKFSSFSAKISFFCIFLHSFYSGKGES